MVTVGFMINRIAKNKGIYLAHELSRKEREQKKQARKSGDTPFILQLSRTASTSGKRKYAAKEPSIPCILSTETKRRQNKKTSIGLYHETACKHYIWYVEAQNSL